MYNHTNPITPTQQAVDGAMSIFVGGCRKGDLRQQLFGLSVLREATEAQVLAAMPFAQSAHQVTGAEIQAMFAR